MSMTNVPANVNQEFLDALARMREEADTGVEEKNTIPQLKINQNELASKHRPGTWVVGMKKDKEQNITDDGAEVVSFIPLTTRRSFSLYSMKDPNINCNSPLFKDWSDEVYGTKHGFRCGSACPHRAMESTPRCSAQIVVFGIAITKDGDEVFCIHYAKGSGYSAFNDTFFSKGNGHIWQMPLGDMVTQVEIYGRQIDLSSVMRKNGGVTFFEPVLTPGKWVAVLDDGSISFEPIQKMHNMHLKTLQAIDVMNNNILKKSKNAGGTAAPAGRTPGAAPASRPAAIDVGGGAMEKIGSMPESYSGTPAKAPQPVSAALPNDDDLAALIQAQLAA